MYKKVKKKNKVAMITLKDWRRMVALIMCLIGVAVIAVVALDNNDDNQYDYHQYNYIRYNEYEHYSGYEVYNDYEHEVQLLTHINVCDSGLFTTIPEYTYLDFSWDYYGYIQVRLPSGTNIYELTVTLPYGWSYWYEETGHCGYCDNYYYRCEHEYQDDYFFCNNCYYHGYYSCYYCAVFEDVCYYHSYNSC